MSYGPMQLMILFGGVILPAFLLANVYHRIGKSRWFGLLWLVPVVNIVAVVVALSKLFGARNKSN